MLKRIGLTLFATLFTPYSSASPKIDQLVEKWINLESQRGMLDASWQERKVILDQQLKLYNKEKQTLEEVINQNKSNETEVDKERLAITQQQTELENTQAKIVEQSRQALHKMKTLAPNLPPPLQTLWQEKFAELEKSTPKNSELLDSVLALLKDVYDFQNRLALHKSKLNVTSETSSNKEVLVSQLYFGISHGWYVSDSGEFFGYGQATPQGWKWWHNNEVEQVFENKFAAEDILAAINIMKNPQKAQFMSLPLQLN